MWATPVTGERSGSVIHMITGGVFENSTRRPVAQRLVRPLVVIEREPPADAPTSFTRRAIRLDENFLVLQAAPQPLDEDIVQKPAFAIHADPDTLGFQLGQERRAGELHALVGVENFRLAMPGASPSRNASTQNSASKVIDTRHARTRRLNQSIAAIVHETLWPSEYT